MEKLMRALDRHIHHLDGRQTDPFEVLGFDQATMYLSILEGGMENCTSLPENSSITRREE